MKDNNKKACLACGLSLAGRSDKKFCDDGCRSSWNNRRRQEDAGLLKKTDAILKRNRRILQDHSGSEPEARLNRRHLMASGFLPDFVTRIEADPAGGLIRYYYEFGMRKLSGQEVEVFRQG